MRTRKSAITFAVLGLGAVLSLSPACAGSNQSGESKVFKVGFSAPFTGPLARTGEEFKGSVQLALKRINSKIGPYQIQPVYVDETSDAAKASADLEQAIGAQGVQAGALQWLSADAITMMDVANRHKVPWFFGFGASGTINDKFKKLSDADRYWMTKGWPVPTTLVPIYADALNTFVQAGKYNPPTKNVAFAIEDNQYGRDSAGALKTKFEQLGWQVVNQDFFPIGTTDNLAILRKDQAKNVSVLFLQAEADTMTSTLKQAQQIGFKGLIIGDGLSYVPNFYTQAGTAADYALDQSPAFQNTPAATQFQADFKQIVGFDASPSAGGLSYDWTNFFLKVLQRTYDKYGSLSSENVHKVGIDEVWTGKLTYTDGIVMKRYQFNSSTIPDMVLGQDDFVFTIVQYFNGKPVTIYPAYAQAADLKVRA
jgi:branched-chain amino acid transport system substrate-binding protein